MYQILNGEQIQQLQMDAFQVRYVILSLGVRSSFDRSEKYPDDQLKDHGGSLSLYLLFKCPVNGHNLSWTATE